MTVNEVNEVLIHAYAYCGFPRSLRAIQTFMQVIEERKSMGIKDVEGRESLCYRGSVGVDMSGDGIFWRKYRVRLLLSLKPDMRYLAPTIERFLKEHLFADLFERDLLTYRERELATVSVLAGVGGVEPMAYGHMSICLHLGITPEQLTALLNIVEINLGKKSSDPLRDVLGQLTDKK